jgi:poly(3-hydroxybutyrate) depolymerase
VSQVFKDSRWQHVADANRLVLLVLSKPSAPSCRGAWYHPNIDVPGPEGPGSDEPYLGAVLSDAIARLGLDSQRIYLTGASSGGSLVYDAACDALNSAKFRGFAAVSAFMEARVSSGRPVVGSERCGTLNNHFFFQNVHGTSDGNVPFGGSCDSTHCIVSFAENARWWAQHMGCAAKPTVTMIGTPTKANEQDDYGTCAFGSPAASYESIKVQNGCHAWSGLDAQPANPSTCAGNPHTNNTNAFYTAQSDWNWFATRSWIG